MLTQIYNGHILTPQGWIDGGSVLMENGLITEIRKNSNFEPHAEKTVDAQGMHVVPGGIELHSHGAGGRDFMEGTAEAFQVAVHSHLLHGTPATIKERRMQEIKENDQKIQQFLNQAESDLKEREKALNKPILDKINAAIRAVGNEGGYTYIIDASQSSIVYTGSDAIDVTGAVKAKLGL